MEPDDSRCSDPDLQPLAAEPPSHRGRCVFLFTLFSFTALTCGAVLYVKLRSAPRVVTQVNSEERALDEVDRLQARGLTAYKEWSQARRDGDLGLEKAKHKEALEAYSAAMDALNRLLERYRDDDGMLLPDYEGYEEQLSQIAIRLGDLVRGARVDMRGSR